ncbi:ATP-dependent DNA helicase RecQ [Tannerella sp. oral taxon BU063 isolate Cell 5]|uniref:ATP-dependent DNA helicase RecQ n=1 Tax=Tannerella sp. oral taxon BU063 isolate Cell 5 TaxID=1410950 RepID=W2CDW3_9BACT|nr:ATP-dependent DNA helicase RecQ [Tannerella sp. oral taxon BU063 isolate Cell 5]
MDRYHEILKKYWGYDAFRPLQEDIIRSVGAGCDTLALMPTGGGKSLTFQVPTLAMDGLCLVVTPLIALMKDQVDNLRRRGIKATAVYMGMTTTEIDTQLDNCIFGDYKFLYLSPERLTTERFLTKLRAMHVCLLAVDECHCISQWGYDFRPSYLRIADIREVLPPDVPVLALTATATPQTVDDIQEKLHFRAPNVLRKSFARPNLTYLVRRCDDKLSQLIRILQRTQGSAVVYVRSRKRTAEIASALHAEGITATFFHAGLSRDKRFKRQRAWMDDQLRVMVATNAFGMGIDKPDVRLVVHIDIPSSLEEYFQEAGRAGRDGNAAQAIALCDALDVPRLRNRISNEYPDRELILRVYDALGSHLGIASGYGLFTRHDFSLETFCTIYRFSFIHAYHALKILELSGYLLYEEEPENASRVRILVTREDLYDLAHNTPHTDIVLRELLRSYSGLFADYAFIDEALLATRGQLTRAEVCEALIQLSRAHIISYIPRRDTPRITFTRSREEPRHVRIPRSAYEDRLDRSRERIKHVIEYITDDRHCRSRLLLRYFGEPHTADCRRCDVCRNRTSSSLVQRELYAVRDTLATLLRDRAPQSIDAIVSRLPLSPEKNLQALRYLLANDAHFRLTDGLISFNAKG